jgi:hypothetical protein
MEVSGQLHDPATYPQGNAPGSPWIGNWEGPGTGLGTAEKRKFLTILGLEIRLIGLPARSQSLHKLRYPTHPPHFAHKVHFSV